ncbi:MAG: MlaD family protein [Bradymonadia bacterium]
MTRWRLPLTASLCASAVIVTTALSACSEEPVLFEVTFPETGGLKPGDNVVLHGLSIGQVRDIDIDTAQEGVVVKVEITPKHRPHLKEGVAFSVASEKLVTGKQMLVMQPAPAEAPALKPGSRIAGAALSPGPVDQIEDALKGTVVEAEHRVRSLIHPDQMPPRATGATIDLDRPGRFVLTLHTVEVYTTQADGDDWDGMGAGDPDLVAQVWVNDRQVMLTEDSEEAFFAEWHADSEPFDLTKGQAEVLIKILDRDVSFNDEIGVITLSPTPADARSGRRFRLAGGRVKEAVISLRPAGQAAAKDTPTEQAPSKQL